MKILKKSETPFFSVIIPTFNRWPLVGDAIDSVLAQTFESFELIVVDDGSTDDSARIIEKQYGERARIIRQINKGVSSARNAGIAAAKARWIAFLDSDDLWMPDKLERQHKAIINDPSLQVLHTDEIWERGGRRVNPGRRHLKTGSIDDGADNLFNRSLAICLISPSSVAVHSEVFRTVGLFDESLPVCEDYDMWLRIMVSCLIGYLPEKLTIKRNEYGAKCLASQLSSSMWGMDRYRVYSLRKLVDSGKLSKNRAKMALNEIARKARIVADGSIKRGKHAEAKLWLIEKRQAVKELASF
ncbi:hypothetical protein MNBD_NITROSPINAE03-901 [hydrothermal vent metagenome]|uniref:Glycosyltransferase 2-like domain-containing protein n=1 Tax=hydrothermal vent metagenome TaxID=652676 RepID=A0A3B1CJH0_9ZZZZ